MQEIPMKPEPRCLKGHRGSMNHKGLSIFFEKNGSASAVTAGQPPLSGTGNRILFAHERNETPGCFSQEGAGLFQLVANSERYAQQQMPPKTGGQTGDRLTP